MADQPKEFVEFRYVRPDATQVYLVASFNGWNPRANRMRLDGEGCWSCRVALAPGSYQFHYLAQIAGGRAGSRQWSCSQLEFALVTPRGGSLEIGRPVLSGLEDTFATQAEADTQDDVDWTSQMQQSLLPLSRLEKALIRCFRRLPDHESRSAFLDVLEESVYC